MTLLFTSSEWNEELLHKVWSEIERIAKTKYKLEYYEPIFEIVDSEQMVDAYCSHGMPHYYPHWSFGKHYSSIDHNYKKGHMGLAYEMVINTDPSIAYLMATNSSTMQTLVMAHASVGHSSFFKNNYLYKIWTNPKLIIPYLKYAKKFIQEAEVKYGPEYVEEKLDFAHALSKFGINYSNEPDITSEMSSKIRKEKLKKRQEEDEKNYSELDLIRPKSKARIELIPTPGYSSSNLLKFLENTGTALTKTDREIFKIVRTISQYFYPQMLTKLMNEGWATFIHYEIMTDLHDEKLISDGAYLEFLHSHTSVVMQPAYKSSYYSGINPYALGFAMFKDIKRMCLTPTEEDLYWFPYLKGQDWVEVCKDAVENYRDESFILQYLSPKVIRDFKLFAWKDDSDKNHYEVTAIHSDEDIHEIRRILAKQYNVGEMIPRLEGKYTKTLRKGEQYLFTYTPNDGKMLNKESAAYLKKGLVSCYLPRADVQFLNF